MEKALESFHAENERLNGRIEDLTQSIEVAEGELKEFDAGYKAAVLSDDDASSDALFKKLEATKGQLARDRSKLKVFQTTNDTGSLAEFGVAATLAANEGIKDLQAEINAQLVEAVEIRNQLLAKMNEIGATQVKERTIIHAMDKVIKVIPSIEKDPTIRATYHGGSYSRKTNIQAGSLPGVEIHTLQIAIQEGWKK